MTDAPKPVVGGWPTAEIYFGGGVVGRRGWGSSAGDEAWFASSLVGGSPYLFLKSAAAGRTLVDTPKGTVGGGRRSESIFPGDACYSA